MAWRIGWGEDLHYLHRSITDVTLLGAGKQLFLDELNLFFEHANYRGIFTTAPVGIEAKVFDKLETLWSYMLGKSQKELKHGHGDEAFCLLTLVADEGHNLSIKICNPRLCYGRMPHIACNITKQPRAIIYRVLGIDVESFRMILEELVDKAVIFLRLRENGFDCCQNMILPDLPQAFVEEEIQVGPVSVISYPTTGHQAMEMNVEFHIFSESVKYGSYSWGDTKAFELVLEDIHHHGQDLSEGNPYELPVIPHQLPEFVW